MPTLYFTYYLETIKKTEKEERIREKG